MLCLVPFPAMYRLSYEKSVPLEVKVLKRIFLFVIIAIGILATESHAQYEKVTNRNLDVYYRIFGSGIPLLIVGGGPGDNSNRYLSLCDLLSPDVQCILVDQRGTGKSMPAILDSSSISIESTISDFEALRENLGLKEWAVLGFSYGGYLSSLYAHEHPAPVSHLILLDSMGLNTEVFGYFFDNIMSRLSQSDKELVDYWNDPLRMERNSHHALVEKIRAMMPGYFYDRKKSLIISQSMKDSDFHFKMGEWIWKDIGKRSLNLVTGECRFGKPVLILHGRQDPLGESVPQILSRYYSNSRLVFVEKAGHYSWIEQPEKISSFIKEFLRSSQYKEKINENHSHGRDNLSGY